MLRGRSSSKSLNPPHYLCYLTGVSKHSSSSIFVWTDKSIKWLLILYTFPCPGCSSGSRWLPWAILSLLQKVAWNSPTTWSVPSTQHGREGQLTPENPGNHPAFKGLLMHVLCFWTCAGNTVMHRLSPLWRETTRPRVSPLVSQIQGLLCGELLIVFRLNRKEKAVHWHADVVSVFLPLDAQRW